LNKLLSLQMNGATLYGNFTPRQYQKAQIAAKSEHFRGTIRPIAAGLNCADFAARFHFFRDALH